MSLINVQSIDVALNATLACAPAALGALQLGCVTSASAYSRERGLKVSPTARTIYTTTTTASLSVPIHSRWRVDPWKQPATLSVRAWLSAQSRSLSTATLPGADAPLNEVVDAVLSCAAKGPADGAEPGVLAQLAHCASRKALELSPEQIRNLLVSFAQLQYYNIPFKSAMADAIVDKMHQFDPDTLADAAWAFGQAEYYDYDLLTHLIPYLKENAGRFDASSMAKMLWLFGRAGYRDDVLMDMMHDVALKLSDKMDSTSLAEVVFAEAQMGWADQRVQALVADYALDNIQAFDPSSLAKMAYGMTSVGYEDDQLYAAICERAVELMAELAPPQVALIMWALGEQAYWHKPFLAAIANSYLPGNMSSFTPQQLQTVVVAFNKLGYSSPAVAAAAMELSATLPALAPEYPGAEDTAASAVLR